MYRFIFGNTLRNFNAINQQFRKISIKAVSVNVNDKGIATVSMKRPHVNALNIGLLNELHEAFEEIENIKATGVILTSLHETVFSAGLDFNTLYKPKFDEFKVFWNLLQDTWLKIYSFKLPTVAVINGHAPAGGCLLAMACEYRIMVSNYIIGLNETQLGIVPPKWLIMNMQEIIGKRQSELAVTAGTLFSTEEALVIGLIDDTADNVDKSIIKAEQIFQGFAKVNPVARHITKMAARKEAIEFLMEYKEEDLQIFYENLVKPFVQNHIEKYIK